MPSTWPLTGRAEELRLATGLIQGPTQGVVIAGAAGVGKTRLARELLAGASRGAITRWVVATESARAIPLGALTLLTGRAGPIRRIEQAVDAVTAGDDRVVIGVDDAHLLDAASAVVVHQMVLLERATVVLTVRSGQPTPDAVTALWKDGHLRRLELQPLSAAETQALLEAVLGGPLNTTAGRRLWTTTQGNPLYLRALLDGERASGRLREAGGVWQWTGEPRLSPELSELIDQRVGELSTSERDLLDVLAFGEPLDLEVLAELADHTTLEILEERGVVEVLTHGGRPMVRTGHPLYGEAQRTRCGTTRARRIRGRIARALVGSSDDETLRRGVLALDSDLPADPEMLSAAAHIALGLAELIVAERLAQAAVAAGAGFAAHLILASAKVGLGRPADAELTALADHARTDGERTKAAALRGIALLVDSSAAASAAVLDTAMATVTDTAAQAELHAVRAVADNGLCRPNRGLARAESALATATLSAEGVAVASWAQVMALGVLGRSEQLNAAARRGLDVLADTPSLRWLAVRLRAHQVVGLCLAGSLAQARDIATTFRADHGRKPLGAEGSAVLVGMVELSAGRIATARRWFLEARAGLLDYPPTVWHAYCLTDLTRAHAQAGDRHAARNSLTELERTPGHLLDYLRPEAMLAEAWVLAAEGVTSAAVARARQAAEFARDIGAAAHEVLALHDAVCLGDRSCADRLTELAGQVDGPFAAAVAAHATALAADDGAALLKACERFERIGMLLRGADAAVHGAGAHTRAGRRGPAQLATATATRLAQTCEGAYTPALRSLATPVALSAREREIATLVHAGLSNREIAERLTVSVRTVEGHIYRACNRLGLTSRDDLAALVHP